MIRLRVQGLTQRFPSRDGRWRTVLDEVSLEIEPGSFTCLLGPSGSGKSTLLHVMAGFERPSQGRVLAGEDEVRRPSPSRPVIFQEPGLFPWRSVLGNVLFALQARGLRGPEARQRALRYLHMVGLGEAADLHPHQLSGGMKQRAAIARALAVEPEALFLDEPFSALDTFTRFLLQDELLKLWRERRTTIVFVTHDIDEAVYLGQRAVLLSPAQGRITRDIRLSLPRPCDRTSPDFLAARREVFAAFELIHEQALEYVL